MSTDTALENALDDIERLESQLHTAKDLLAHVVRVDVDQFVMGTGWHDRAKAVLGES